MIRKPKEWTLVIPGSWNPGILTPSGIAKRIFKLPEGTPVEIEILVDDYQPFRVKHGPLVVQCGRNVLHITVEEFSKDALLLGVDAACAAMAALPETPLVACGINLKYEVLEPVPDVLTSLKSGFDDPLSDLGFGIQERTVRLGLVDEPGVINLEVSADGKGMRVSFNFHRASTRREDLEAWLRRPLESVFEKVERILTEGLRCPAGKEA